MTRAHARGVLPLAAGDAAAALLRQARALAESPPGAASDALPPLPSPCEQIGMSLTESMAMLPASSVSGLYFANPCSQYFAVGKITQEQVSDYASRKKVPSEESERWLRTMLSYEP